MKRVSIVLAAAGATMALAPGVASAHKVHYDADVSINFFSDPYDPYGTTFFGTVTSEKNACVKNRTVKIKREEGNDDPVFGTDTTDNDGDYTIADGPAPAGDYYAKAKKRFLKDDKKHKHICDAATSPTVAVP